jgi:hypothetical protein
MLIIAGAKHAHLRTTELPRCHGAQRNLVPTRDGQKSGQELSAPGVTEPTVVDDLPLTFCPPSQLSMVCVASSAKRHEPKRHNNPTRFLPEDGFRTP